MPSHTTAVRRDHPLNRGLVSWWLPTPNNSGGQTLFDLVGLNDGTLTNGPTWTAGRDGFPALSFDGANDYVNCGSPVGLNGATAATISAWLYRSSTGTTVGLGGCGGNTSGGDNRFSLVWWTDGNLYFSAAQTSFAGYSLVALSGTGWRHVAIVYDGSQSSSATRAKLFVDGLPQSVTFASAVGTALGNVNPFWLGADASDRFSGGTICGAGLHLRALADSEVYALYDQAVRGYPDLIDRTPKSSVRYFIGNSDLTASFTPQSVVKPKGGGPGGVAADSPVETGHPLNRGLVSWWLPLDGNSGGRTLFDIAGRNHGTLTNDPTWGVGPNGFGAVQFDGSNDYVECGTAGLSALGGNANRTIACWARPSGLSAYLVAASLDAGGGVGWAYLRVQLSASGTQWQVNARQGNSTEAYFEFGTPTVGKWDHVALTIDSAYNFTAYLNGVKQNTADVSSVGLYSGSGASMRLGTYSLGGAYWNGAVGTTQVYNRALSASEVYGLYEQSLRGYPDLLRRTSSSTWFVPESGGAALTLTASAASFAYTAQSANLLRGRRVTADASSFAYTAQSANLLRGRRLTADASSTTVSGQDATFRNTRVVGASASAFTVSGQTAGILRGRLVSADASAFTYTAQSAGVLRGRLVSASASSFVVTGQAAGTIRTRIMGASASAFTITGQTATLSTSAGKTVTANVAGFVVTGTAAGLLFGRRVVASASSVAYTAQSAGVLRGRVVAASASALTVAGQDVTFRNTRVVSASAATVTITPQAATVARGRILACSASALSYTATAAALYRGRAVSADTSSVVVSAQPAALYRSRRTAALASSYSVGGGEATLTYSGDPDGGYATHVLKIPLRG